jgi:hypothetical protein
MKSFEKTAVPPVATEQALEDLPSQDLLLVVEETAAAVVAVEEAAMVVEEEGVASRVQPRIEHSCLLVMTNDELSDPHR